MDAIKKKMGAMKAEKDQALIKADNLEQKVAEQKSVNEKVPSMVQPSLPAFPAGIRWDPNALYMGNP